MAIRKRSNELPRLQPQIAYEAAGGRSGFIFNVRKQDDMV